MVPPLIYKEFTYDAMSGEGVLKWNDGKDVIIFEMSSASDYYHRRHTLFTYSDDFEMVLATYEMDGNPVSDAHVNAMRIEGAEVLIDFDVPQRGTFLPERIVLNLTNKTIKLIKTVTKW